MAISPTSRVNDLITDIKQLSNVAAFTDTVGLCLGSLTACKIRLAGATATDQKVSELVGPFEIVSLVGTIAGDRAHLHISVADKTGAVFGGHLMPGSIVETTAEVVLVNLRPAGIVMTREPDAATGFRELVVNTALP